VKARESAMNRQRPRATRNLVGNIVGFPWRPLPRFVVCAGYSFGTRALSRVEAADDGSLSILFPAGGCVASSK
jgi:hypothetical protein